ncbi:unnamed protein product, partial [Owenia fusiformis]
KKCSDWKVFGLARCSDTQVLLYYYQFNIQLSKKPEKISCFRNNQFNEEELVIFSLDVYPLQKFITHFKLLIILQSILQCVHYLSTSLIFQVIHIQIAIHNMQSEISTLSYPFLPIGS